MIAVMIPGKDFSYSAACDKGLTDDCWSLCGHYSETEPKIEFFYYVTPNDADRFFIVRVQPATVSAFISSVEEFAARQNFEILNGEQSRHVLKKINLDSFV